MDYIDEIISHMEQNIGNIYIREVDELRKRFNISTSTFNRNFKRKMHFTPRDYLINMKIELAHRYKSNDPALTVKEVVLKIGWDLTERQFTELFKSKYGLTFGGKSISAEDKATDPFDDFMCLKEKEQLEEILLRLVLLAGHFNLCANRELSRNLVYELENTCFQIPTFNSAKELIFYLSFDHNNIDRLGLFLVITQTDSVDHCFVPNGKSFYLNLIYQVAINQEETMRNDILECILNWEEMTVLKVDGELGDYLPHFYYKDVYPEINRNAGLFKYSQAAYGDIIQQFKEEYETLLQSINILEPDLSRYMQAIEEMDELLIKSALESLCRIDSGDLTPQKLDLLLRLAEYPDMQFVEFADYSFNFDESLIERVLQALPRCSLPQLIYNYCLDYKKMMEGDDDNCDEYLGNFLLSDLLDDLIEDSI